MNVASSAASRRLYYGWVVVGVAFLSLFFSLGIRFSYSLFFLALTREFGWDRAVTSSIFSFSLVVFAILAPALGFLVDRIGSRVMFVAGSLLLSLGLMASATTQSYWHLLIYYGIVSATGMAILSLGLHSIVLSRWFVKRRGLAIGLAFAGTGLGQLVLAPVSERLISLGGWRFAYLALGLTILVLLLPANGIWARTRPQELNLLPDGALESPNSSNLAAPAHTARSVFMFGRFWLLVVGTLLAMFSVRLIIVHAVVHLVDIGFDSLFAAAVFGIVGGVEGISTILWGWFSDRVGRLVAFSLGSLCVVVSLLILLYLPGHVDAAGAILFAIAYGLGDSSRPSLLNALAADMFDGPELGAISGFLISAFALGGALGPWFGGYLYDLQSQYTSAFWIAIAATIVSTVLIMLAGRRTRVMHQAELIEI
jgi:MFS family permease